MIDEEQLLLWKPHYMDERQLEKNYLQTLILYELYNDFSNELVFKGGTALSMFYGLDRFSEDLDFTYTKEEVVGKIIASFEKDFNRVSQIYAADKVKRRGTSTSLDFEMRIKGPLFRTRKTPQTIEVNVSMREKLCMGPDLKQLAPLYADIATFLVPVMKPEEILAEKVRAVLTRKGVKARDIYDIYFLTDLKKIKPNRGLIDKKLAYYNVQPSKTEFKKKLNEIDKNAWKSEMSNIIRIVPEHKKIVEHVMDTISAVLQ